MAPSLIFNLSDVDPDANVHGTEEIEAVNPHRGNMRLLDRIAHVSDDARQYVAVKEVGHDEFWVDGHIPGRPIFPGVLMIEAAAQLSSFMFLRKMKQGGFMGFAGVDDVRFRGQVTCGDRLLILGEEINFRPRRAICQCQAVVNGNLVFEARIKGMPL